MITEEDVYRYLLDSVQPIYADVVAMLGEKPTQLVFQFEAAFVHLAVARTHPELARENLDKAMGHLQRAALDAGKILWLHKKRALSAIVSDADLRRFCVNLSETQLLSAYQQAEQLGREARRLEIAATGVDPEAAVAAYDQAARAFDEVLQHVDADKMRHWQRFRLVHLLRGQGLGLTIGVVAGLLATWLWSWWS